MRVAAIASPEKGPSPQRSVLGLAVLLLLGLLATAAVKSYRELAAARRHEGRLEVQIERAQERVVDLENRLRLLEDDDLTLERMAREELGMVRPGDVVIVLPDDDPGGVPR